MTTETPVGEGLTATQRLFVEAYSSPNFVNRLRDLRTHLQLSGKGDASSRSFLIWSPDRRVILKPFKKIDISPLVLTVTDSDGLHSETFLESQSYFGPSKSDLELLRKVTEASSTSQNCDLVLIRGKKEDPTVEILIIQEGPNFRGEAKRNSTEQMPTWFNAGGELKESFELLVKKGYYRRMTFWLPNDQRVLEEWQKKQLVRFHQ